MIMVIHFSGAFAESHTFEIRCGAVWFVALDVVVVGISQIREVVGGDSFCGGLGFFVWQALGGRTLHCISHSWGSCITCEHLTCLCTQSFSHFYIFINSFVFKAK